MSKRPPFLGYNHNVRHAGHLFHVQTEDSGLSRLTLFTHCFVDGTILASLRATYTAEESDAVVQKRMQDQHKAMLRRVRDGEFDNHPEVLARAGQASPQDKSAVVDASQLAAAAVPTALPSETGSIAIKAPLKAEAKPMPSTASKPEAKPEARPEAKADHRPEPKAESKSDAGALAARLGIKSLAQPIVPAPPSVAAASSDATAASKESGETDSDDDLMIDIVAAEPSDAEEEALELSKATPLPTARPLVGSDSAESVPVYPPSPNPLYQVTVGLRSERPIRVTRPVYVRPLHTGRLRMQSTSEGAVMLTPVALRPTPPRRHMHVQEPLRKTLPQALPTIPGAVVAIGLGAPPLEGSALDDALMAFLRKEAARPL
ncbi:MAG: hypothetical protein JNJ46_29240 [Myxococcales bacterium]|nr:hypothetical protein [Myxococcales bacterium]